jgi:hypothetical protein
MMNEFVAKKLGEVLAFANVSLETLERGKAGYKLILNDEQIRILSGLNISFKERIEEISKKNNAWAITSTKANATGNKLVSMRDLYIKDEWDNPVELVEWSGFFLGAAIVHWKLVLGAAERIGLEELSTLAHNAIQYHEESLALASEYLRETGSKRAA